MNLAGIYSKRKLPHISPLNYGKQVVCRYCFFLCYRMNYFGQFSPINRLKSEPCSEPFVAFRNLSRQTVEVFAESLFNGPDSTTDKRMISFEQAKYYNEKLSEHHIPVSLLREHIYESENMSDVNNVGRQFTTNHLFDSSNELIPMSSTVATFINRRRPYVIHVTGECHDQLVLRDVCDCQPHSTRGYASGFYLPTTRGAELIDILPIGTSNFGLDHHFLVRSSNELHHIKTLCINDIQPPDEHINDNSNYQTASGGFPSHSLILEPLQSWLLPADIVGMSSPAAGSHPSSCSSLSSHVYASVLCVNGCIYKWSPSDGLVTSAAYALSEEHFIKCSQDLSRVDNSLVSKSQSSNSSSSSSSSSSKNKGDWSQNSVIASSSFHSLQTFLSYKRQLYHLDARSSDSSSAVPLASTQHPISCIQQDLDASYLLYLCYNGSVVSLDIRNTASFVAHRDVSDSHARMKLWPSRRFQNLGAPDSGSTPSNGGSYGCTAR